MKLFHFSRIRWRIRFVWISWQWGKRKITSFLTLCATEIMANNRYNNHKKLQFSEWFAMVIWCAVSHIHILVTKTRRLVSINDFIIMIIRPKRPLGLMWKLWILYWFGSHITHKIRPHLCLDLYAVINCEVWVDRQCLIYSANIYCRIIHMCIFCIVIRHQTSGLWGADRMTLNILNACGTYCSSTTMDYSHLTTNLTPTHGSHTELCATFTLQL